MECTYISHPMEQCSSNGMLSYSTFLDLILTKTKNRKGNNMFYFLIPLILTLAAYSIVLYMWKYHNWKENGALFLGLLATIFSAISWIIYAVVR
jgi:hypothetical protein